MCVGASWRRKRSQRQDRGPHHLGARCPSGRDRRADHPWTHLRRGSRLKELREETIEHGIRDALVRRDSLVATTTGGVQNSLLPVRYRRLGRGNIEVRQARIRERHLIISCIQTLATTTRAKRRSASCVEFFLCLVLFLLSFHWIQSLFAEERTNGANETIINVCYCYSDGQIDVH
mgnify:CR=1 FL=1